VLAVVVDQLSSWVADERVPLLPPGGFFSRLVREGTWAHAMRYPYAQTDTGPGHAALHTGAVPAESGIVLNEVPASPGRGRVSALQDESTRFVTSAGISDSPGSSAARLLVPTVADRLRAARPDATILSVSLKDRGALLPAGKAPTHALWFDARVGAFVTSTAIEKTLPAWASAIGDVRAVARARGEVWEPTDRRWLSSFAGPDDAPGEGDLDGLGTTFPHVAKTNAAFRAMPASDAMILDLALAGVKAEYRPDKPLFVLLSMSASDVIGHTFGPRSWEAWDQLRKLDAALGRFVDALEAHVGSPVQVVVSGDHGNIPMPWGQRAPRLEPTALGRELRDEAARALGSGDWVTGVSDGYVFLSDAARGLGEPKRAALDAAVRRVLVERHRAETAEVFDGRELAKRCPDVLGRASGVPERAEGGEDLLTLVCRSWRPDAAGDYYVVPRPGSFFDGEIVPGKGGGHGTPYLYDRTVPLFVRGAPGAMEPGRDIEDPVDFTAFSGLEAAFLGLERRTPEEVLEQSRLRGSTKAGKVR
jgi:hypothetical protein